jgi:release factor glutamine methyltransferase
MISVGALWREIQQDFEIVGINPAPREARQLVGQVLGWGELALATRENEPVPAEKLKEIQELAARRRAGEPLAYVLGSAPFMGRQWLVKPGVLIPRPDSETLVLVAAAKGGWKDDGRSTGGRSAADARSMDDRSAADAPVAGLRVAEVGVGSGAIIGSLLLAHPHLHALATDISPAALTIARDNLRSAGVLPRCELRQADLLESVDEPLALVVSNPPYIAAAEWAALEPEVRDHEPREALLAGPDGLALYRRLIPQALARLVPGGWLVLEIGHTQAAAVSALLTQAGFTDIERHRDLAGRDRVLAARKP